MDLGGQLPRSLNQKVRSAWSQGGLAEVGRRAYARSKHLVGPRYRSPLDAASGISGTLSNITTHALATIAVERGTPLPSSLDLADWTAEYDAVSPGLNVLTGGSFDSEYDIGRASGQLIYFCVRWLRPALVVETGVARGASSMLILAAMDRSEYGSLQSFDVTQSVGDLVPKGHDRWSLEVLDGKSATSQFASRVRSLGPIDMFLHDSDHRAAHQLLEYEVAWANSAGGFVLFSDDVNASSAFADFSQTVSAKPVYLQDEGKTLGALVRANLT